MNATFIACVEIALLVIAVLLRESASPRDRRDQSCTPWKSTPALKMSELRASASAVQIAAIGAAPDADALARRRRAVLQEVRAGDNVLVFATRLRGPACSGWWNARP